MERRKSEWDHYLRRKGATQGRAGSNARLAALRPGQFAPELFRLLQPPGHLHVAEEGGGLVKLLPGTGEVALLLKQGR